MTDLDAIREQAEHGLKGPHLDEFASFAATSFAMAFNHRVPDEMRVELTSALGLRIGLDRTPSVHDLAIIMEHSAKAVAAIGKEVVAPNEPLGNITAADYERASAYATTTPLGLLVLSPRRGEVFAGSPLQSTAEKALSRLGGIFPDSLSGHVDSALSGRPGTLRAIREMADVARQLGDLHFELVGEGEPVESFLSRDQASNVTDLLRDRETSTTTLQMEGVMDGMRWQRRIFYLTLDNGTEITGLIDEPLVPKVRDLIHSQRVCATVEKVVVTTRDGRRPRPSFRLVELGPATDSPPAT